MLLQTVVILLCAGFTIIVHCEVTTEDNASIQQPKPKVDAMDAKFTGLKMTKEDWARVMEQIKADESKVAKLVGEMQEPVPESFNWKEAHPNYITDVGDQGVCGSCWAFAFAGLLESRYAIQHKTKAVPLSKSELVECAITNGENKCMEGGYFELAYNYTTQNGLVSEEEYPYENANNSTNPCKRSQLFPINETVVKPIKPIKSVGMLAWNNHQHTKNLLYQNGPVFVAVNAALLSMSRNNFDIIRKDDVNCCPSYLSENCPNKNNSINHAVLLVGYGVENNVRYWIIRNSWGSDIGKGGYQRMERGTNTCGIETAAQQVITN